MPDYNSNIKASRILVTGGAGFIGSNIVSYLLDKGVKHVRVLDDLSNGYRHNIQEFESLPNFEFLEGDIRDLDTCRRAMAGMDYVSHQAALGSVPRSIADPLTSHNVNATGFLNMCVALKESSSVKRMVYAASSSTYGDHKGLPKVENQIGNPLSPYAVTKYLNELYADVFGRTYNTDMIGLRYFNVYGPKQSPNGPYAAVIPLFMQALLDGNAPIINGDGEQTRDFTYVANAVQANVKAMFANKEAANQVFNVACGERISVNQLWQYLSDASEKRINPKYGPSRQGDVRDSLADISKAKNLIDYEPEVFVKEGLKYTWNWFSNTSS